MKKRTLVCFLIFTLCVFYTSMPNTVFGQEEGVALAKQVFDEYSETLQRDDVKTLLPEILGGLQGAGDDVDIPGLIDLAINLVNAGQGATLQGLAAQQGVTLTDDHIALLADVDVQTLLTAETTKQLLGLKGAELQAGLVELLRLANEPVEEVTPPKDDEEEVTPPKDDEEEVTPPKDDEEEVTPPKDDEVLPPVEVPMADPFDPAMPNNLLGKSQLGGLSLNNASGRKFVEQIIAALAPAGITLEAEFVVDAILDQVPKGFINKKQVRQLLLSRRLSAFPEEASQLDSENFGNAITPNFTDFLYTDFGDAPNQKYLTSNGLHVYTRVPAKVAGVEFGLSDGTTVSGTEVTMDEFQQTDTIPYTFRLEETLAATNLPAWPALNTQLFSEVKIWYSTTSRMDDAFSDTMDANNTGNGVVWEKQIGIPASGSVYYYFEVVLAEPLTFTALDRDAIADLDPTTVTLADVFNPANLHKIRIEKWSMPDPRNLQLADRGIVDALFTPNLEAEVSNILRSPQVLGIAAGVITGQSSLNELLDAVPGRQLRKIRRILINNTNNLMNTFQTDFDPLLASVLSIPRVDLETQSLWTAHIPIPADGNYQLRSDVLADDGTVLDRIQENITVDTSAPEADIGISPGDANTTGYMNDDGIYVATVHTDSTAGALKIMGMPKVPAELGPGRGYLFYQIIGLDEDGMPALEESPNTWMPLTVDSTMLTSNIWEAVKEAVAAGRIGAPTNPILQTALALPLEGILGILNAGYIQQAAGPFLKGLEPYIGFSSLSDSHAQLIVDALDATRDIIDHLVPVTFNPSGYVMMMPLVEGDYGIRALGIDTLFNVSSHTPPTRLRIVDSSDPVHRDRASVMSVVIGDCNMDGDMEDRFESGPIGHPDVRIFNNTTDKVMLTVKVDHRSGHPAMVSVQYKDAAGVWQEIDKLDLDGTETGSTLTVNWKVADFDELIGAGSTVSVRAVASNALLGDDLEAMEGMINLDAGICPLDPEVIAITVDPATTTNSVSGAPQGMLTLNAYTPSRTSTDITSVRLAAKGPQDAEWTIAFEDSEVVSIGGQALADLLGDLVDTIGAENPTVNVDRELRKWTITIDTTKLMDTITKGSADDNQYVVTGYANTAGGEMPPKPGVDEKFSVDNIGPTNITAVATADGAVEAGEDGSYTVGGLVDKYDETVESPMVTFTITSVSYRGSYTSVMLVTDAEGASIGEASETAEGSGVFEITVDAGILADGEYLENGTYMFHAVAVDAEGAEVAETDGAKISVNVENTYRPAPEILAITTDPAAETNPDSGAPKGTVTVNAYSIGEITSPLITGMRFEAKRQNDDDSAWQPVGTTEEGTAVTSEEVQELQHLNIDSLSDLITVAAGNAAGSAEPSPIHRYQSYQKWTLDIDTVALELPDTIDKDSPAARDVSKDDNPYVVRAVAISAADEGETGSPEGVQSTFSLDNVDDVSPLGPTNIVAVADVAGMIEANEDGSYTVGGIVDDTVPSPIATFTAEPTADPMTYASVNLVQTTEDSAETVAEGEAGVLDLTIDVGLLENGTYMFHALAVDESGNIQEDDSPMVTVHIRNFRVDDITDLAVSAVDDTDVADAPAEPIPLRESVTVSFMVPNGSLAAEELSGAVDGSEVPSESAEDPENTFSLKVEVGALVDGVYTPDGVVTKRNGSVAFPLTTVNVDNTGPMVIIESPMEDETVESLPTIRATYHDGAGAGVDGATGSLALARLQPPNETEVVVDQADLEKDAASLVYTRSEPLAGGAYRVTVQVTDNLGNVGEGSAEFVVNGTAPMVAIHSPASGQTFAHGKPPISGEFSGAGTVEITTFTINDVDATPEVDGNQFSYTPAEALADGDYKVVVAVTDGDGNMAQTSSVFTVDMPRDTTPPVISAAAPTGIIKDPDPDKAGSAKVSAVVTDEQSAISSVKYSINGGQLRSIAKSNIVGGKIEAPIDFEAHGAGLYNVRLVASSEGGTTEHTWSFTLVVDNIAPAITSITPSGTIRGGLPVISASANDDSGVSKMTITVWDSAGKEVKGKAANDGEKDVEGITRVDFNLEAPLEEGVYTVEVRATDPYNNSASAKGTFTIDFDTAAPVITMASPQNEARLTNRRPLISIAYADAESGVDVDSIRFIFNSNVINLKPNQKTASQVLYRPEADLPFGQHTVRLEVSDMAQKEGNVSEKNKGAREANMAAYEFTFFVESVEGPILVARPINVPNPFKDETHISFALTRQSVVSIAIYDSTLRPVRVLMDNKILDAGNYFGKDGGILWNGKSSGDGEDLARGIYYCQIIVGDGIEPEYAILKLALTR